MDKNLLFYGDNLEILRRYIDKESIDLIYLDPPFKSDQDYNIIFAERNGTQSVAQIKAFEDTWHWDVAAAKTYQEVVESGGKVSQVMQAFRTFLGENDMMAYLSMIAPRLLELRKVLKPTGSIYLHCDSAASHYLKLLMDAIFGAINFRNEIILRRTGSNKGFKRFGPIHQTILFYVKTEEAPFYQPKGPYTEGYIENYFTEEDERGRYRPVILTGPGVRDGDSGLPWRGYNPTDVGRHWQPASYLYKKYKELTGEDLAQYPLIKRLEKLDKVGLIHWGPKSKVPNYKYYLLDAPGVPYQDIWAYQPGTEDCVYGRPKEGIDQDVKWLSTLDKERLGYPTQKPEGVLERIIKASSKEGDVVLDPFCGCGTAIAVAHRLNRHWIGIDITHLAIALIKHRLKDAFGDKIEYDVIGEPKDLSGAITLAKQDPYQFQWWALGLVNARPVEQKKGADRGIDGRMYFFERPEDKKPKQIIFSVKSGKVTPSQIRDLRGVVEREKAAIGVFITLNPPTRDMIRDAATAGFYIPSELTSERYPKIQILTIEELLNGKTLACPPFMGHPKGNVTFKKAPKAKTQKGRKRKQKTLDTH